MSELQVHIYSKGDKLPTLTCHNFFHSEELFHVCENTPRMRPYMVVIQDEDKPVCHLLAILRYRSSLFPPYLYMHCRMYGEGDFEPTSDETGKNTDELFAIMLQAITRKLQRWVLYIEVSNLSTKMFAYRHFRENRYFPVHWMRIYNSLHSRPPQERITEKMKQRIERSRKKGVITKEVETEEEFKSFMRLMRRHNWFKPKRYIPDNQFFRLLMNGQNTRLFITQVHQKTIGCCACNYSEGNAYMWYSAFRRKSYMRLHPDLLTVWHAISHAYEYKYNHIFFMDVGLPFSRNPFREFLLSFGGKPVSSYRWFRCNIRWINGLLSMIYKD
ncbi:MAG: GNAT family N-acetyltransferase [Prevotella sp.]|nr:GNAT family N-acetyltransferase [Prevotella sp.]